MASLTSRLLRSFPYLAGLTTLVSRQEKKYEAVEKDTRKTVRCAPVPWLFGINVGLFFIYFGFFVYSIQNLILHPSEKGLIYCKSLEPPELYCLNIESLTIAPARSYISYEKRTLDSSIQNDFSAPPSLESDAAWHQLLTCRILAI